MTLLFENDLYENDYDRNWMRVRRTIQTKGIGMELCSLAGSIFYTGFKLCCQRRYALGVCKRIYANDKVYRYICIVVHTM